jgi:hypothetical protein
MQIDLADKVQRQDAAQKAAAERRVGAGEQFGQPQLQRTIAQAASARLNSRHS